MHKRLAQSDMSAAELRRPLLNQNLSERADQRAGKYEQERTSRLGSFVDGCSFKHGGRCQAANPVEKRLHSQSKASCRGRLKFRVLSYT
jgi:hypothetical protein